MLHSQIIQKIDDADTSLRDYITSYFVRLVHIILFDARKI